MEPQQGKSFALNRGIREARGNVLAFTDDDVTMDPDEDLPWPEPKAINRWWSEHRERFMPGEDVGSALDAASSFAKEGIGTLLTELGEQIENVGEAAEVRDDYFKLLDQIAARKLPTRISAKPTHLGMTEMRVGSFRAAL